jgi:Domain of unknown function (DUF4386)
MEPASRTARIAGAFFVATFVTSIPAALLYEPVLSDPAFVLGDGSDLRIRFGALLEVLLLIANIGTAVTLFPVLKRHNEAASLGYVATRVVESTVIAVGLACLLAVLTLRADAGAAGNEAALVEVGGSLVAIHGATTLLGPAFCAGFGNGILLGYLLYRSGLVPRRLAVFGMVAGSLAFASATTVLLGLSERSSGIGLVAYLPEIAWEALLGVWLLTKGLRRPASVTVPGGQP